MLEISDFLTAGEIITVTNSWIESENRCTFNSKTEKYFKDMYRAINIINLILDFNYPDQKNLLESIEKYRRIIKEINDLIESKNVESKLPELKEKKNRIYIEITKYYKKLK